MKRSRYQDRVVAKGENRQLILRLRNGSWYKYKSHNVGSNRSQKKVTWFTYWQKYSVWNASFSQPFDCSTFTPAEEIGEDSCEKSAV